MTMAADQQEFEFTEQDLLEGHARLRQALSRVDVRTAEIIACHLALEGEIDRILEELVPNFEHLRRLAFGQKVCVLQACFNHRLIKLAAEGLLNLDGLRNAIAHPRDRRQVKGAWKKLCTGLEIDPDTATVAGVANALTSALVILGAELMPLM
jgi:hypothetical protein